MRACVHTSRSSQAVRLKHESLVASGPIRKGFSRLVSGIIFCCQARHNSRRSATHASFATQHTPTDVKSYPCRRSPRTAPAGPAQQPASHGPCCLQPELSSPSPSRPESAAESCLLHGWRPLLQGTWN
eukprot:2861726-Pleurochrysis_carterae.AAC.3